MKVQPTNRPCWIALWMLIVATVSFAKKEKYFERVSTFLPCEQIDANCNTDTETVAETVWYYTDGDLTFLVYTDAETEALGFVDITDPSNPVAGGTVPLGGEPTTVRVIGDYAIVGVNTSPDYVNPSGTLTVVSLSSGAIIDEIDLGGQPDAVDVSKDQTKIAVAIENERDEDLGDGGLPQEPPGFVVIFDVPNPMDCSTWVKHNVYLADEDPEPEYVAFNSDGTKVIVTLQENNKIALIDTATYTVDYQIDYGSVVLENVDLTEEDPDEINQDETTEALPREPDGVTWIGDTTCIATANEGDWLGGTRGISIFDTLTTEFIYDSGSAMDHEVVRVGHYNDGRSGNKGNEPENVLYAEAMGEKYLFVCSERSNLVFVYEVSDPSTPELRQTLPVGVGPEGLAFIPEENLLVVASEKDDREDGFRASITLFKLKKSKNPEYPTLVSSPRDEEAGTSIPFGQMKGLGGSVTEKDCLFTVSMNRVLMIETSSFPATVVAETPIVDTNGLISGNCVPPDYSLDDVVNDDGSLGEGIRITDIANVGEGVHWMVSGKEPNVLLQVTDGVISSCVAITLDGAAGIAVDGDNIVVAMGEIQEDESMPRIMVYNTVSMAWKFAFYPLESPSSQYTEDDKNLPSLSDMASLGNGKFLVTEVDETAGPDAGVKMICSIDLDDFSFEDGSVLTKALYLDLVAEPLTDTAPFLVGVGGLAVNGKDVWVDNDVNALEYRLKKVSGKKMDKKNGKKDKTNGKKKDKKNGKAGKNMKKL